MNINDILNPVLESDFKNEYFKTKALHIEGHREKFSGIISWEDINTLVSSVPLPDKDIFLINSGNLPKYDSIKEITNQINLGSTLVINKLHTKHFGTGVLAENVGHFFQEPTQVNLYLGQPKIGGFDIHYDTHDVFVFQLSGNKKWDIYEPSLDFPVFNMKNHGRDRPQHQPYMSVVLNAGDFLYVPRGHWHSVVAVDEPSLHLTLGIKSRTGLDFLKWLTDELSEDKVFREEFTFNNNAHFDKLSSNLSNLLKDENIKGKYMDFCRNNQFIVPKLELPFILKKEPDFDFDNTMVGIRFTINVLLIEETENFVVEFNDKKIKLSNKVRPLMDVLLKRIPVKISEIRSPEIGLSKDQIFKITKLLLNEGLLSVHK